jgi:hypothetical protein
MSKLQLSTIALSLVFASGCRTDKSPFEEEEEEELPGTEEVDLDRDGFLADEDCNDNDSAVFPGATEICDGIDNDCDDAIDEEVLSTFYADVDGDGFGNAEETMESCEGGDGWVGVGNDCDDADAESFPGAAERCDGIDNDCDSEIDEEVRSTWYTDSDGDGYGDAESELEDCDPPEGYVSDSSDCDDTTAVSYPGASEICDYLDNDCDGEVDEEVTTTYYEDSDGDGFGLADSTTEDCSEPSGYAAVADDCDDDEAEIHPDATEYCDEVDNDCDGVVDEDDAADASTWYLDADGDGFGDAATTMAACEAPSGYLDDASDCDDTDSSIHPDATEYCDEVDNDCDGTVDNDDAADASTWYADLDGDGYGDLDNTTTACEQPSDYVDDDSDCADSDADAWPGSTSTETPGDGIDTDCDGNDFCTDLSCDGIPDMAIGTYYSGSSYVADSLLYFGSGSDFSDSDVTAVEGSGTWDIVVDDLDGDGYQDVVLATYYTGSSYSGYSYVYWGGASGYSSANREDIPTSGAHRILVEDFNSDGYKDLVFTAYYNGSYYTYTYVYYGSSRGYSTGSVDYLYTPGAWIPAAADLDGDGNLDLVICRYYAYAYDLDSYVFWGDGTEFTDSNRTDLATNGCRDVLIEDLDSDGWSDIVFANHYSSSTGFSTNGQVYWGSSAGYSDSDLTELPTTGPVSVDSGDFNGDGYADLAFGSYYAGGTYSSSATIYYGDGSDFDSTVTDSLTSTGTWEVQAADLDNDGYDDLVLPTYYDGSSYSGSSYIYYGDSTGIGGTPDTLSTSGVREVAIGDLDGNGYPELVFNHYYSGSWSSLVGTTVYWGDGSGYSGSRSTDLDTEGTLNRAALVGNTDW